MTDQRNNARSAWAALKEAGGIATAAEMADRLDLSRSRVSQIVSRDDFPEPVDTLGNRPVWLWADVQAWRATERKTGRPAG